MISLSAFLYVLWGESGSRNEFCEIVGTAHLIFDVVISDVILRDSVDEQIIILV